MARYTEPDCRTCQIRPCDSICHPAESRGREYISTAADFLKSKQASERHSVNATDLSGRATTMTARDQMEIPQFNEALIVEYYSH